MERPWEVERDQRWRFLFDTKFRSDAVLVIGLQNQEVKVHRSVLELSSEIFYEEFQKVNNNRLIITDTDPELFIIFLRHLYLGDSGASVEDCLPLLQLAKKYQAKDLKEFCEQKLQTDLTIENVTILFQQAMEIGHKDLTKKMLDFLCRKAWIVVKSETFLELRQECLYEIVKQDELRVRSEMQLFNAVLRWGEAECSRQKLDGNETLNLRKVLGKVLGLIRFPLMDKEEFILNVSTRELLEDNELISILLFFNVSTKKRVLIPQGRFNASPRNYNMLCNEIYTLFRCPEDQEFQLELKNWGKSEILKFKSDKSIVLLGFKIFDLWRSHPQRYDRDCEKHAFDNLELNLSIKDISSGDCLLDETKKPFNIFQSVNLKEGVKIEANLWYAITATLSGQATLWNKSSQTQDAWNLFPIFTGLQSNCSVGCENEGGEMEKINFQFRLQSSDGMPIEDGSIEEFIFKLSENN